MPCPHFDVKIIQRSKRQSAVASAAYQSGERLFSEYDQKQKYYSHKSEIVHTEIMLPPHAPPEYADRNTLWNAAEAIEKQWNSQLARRLVLAIPRDIPTEQQADLIRDYCREFFVSKGMIADFAIHDKGDGNPHAHILFTMRGMDEQGKWLPKSRKVYDLDENGERIRLPSGNWKSHKEDTVDWNDQKYYGLFPPLAAASVRPCASLARCSVAAHRPRLRRRGVPALRTPFRRVLAPPAASRPSIAHYASLRVLGTSALRAFIFSQAFALQKMPEMTYTPSFLMKASFFRYFVNALGPGSNASGAAHFCGFFFTRPRFRSWFQTWLAA